MRTLWRARNARDAGVAERLDALLAGTALRRADLLGFSSLKTYDPSPDSLKGRTAPLGRAAGQVPGLGVRGGDPVVLHLSQAGRLDVEEPPKKTKPRGSVARFVFGQGDAGLDGEGVGILVREFGTQRKASWWAPAAGDEGPLAGPGPEEAMPSPRPSAPAIRVAISPLICATSTWRLARRGWGDDICTGPSRPPAPRCAVDPNQREAFFCRDDAC